MTGANSQLFVLQALNQALRLDVMQGIYEKHSKIQSMARTLYSMLRSTSLYFLYLELVWFFFMKHGKNSSLATVTEYWNKKIQNSPRAIIKQATWSIDFYRATGGIK